MRCGRDLERFLWKDIVLVGGSSLFPGLNERLRKDVAYLAPARVVVKVLASAERKHSVWVGGSIYASLSFFAPQCMSKSAYVHRRLHAAFVFGFVLVLVRFCFCVFCFCFLFCLFVVCIYLLA